MAGDPIVMSADDPRRVEFENLGYVTVARSWGAYLDLPDLSLLSSLVDRVAEIAVVRELNLDDVQKVLELDAATIADFPGGVATAHPPLTRERATPGASRRAFGALTDGRLVAMSFLDIETDHVETDFTVVAEPWRGRGLGLAVKAASILSLMASGVTRFRTGGSYSNSAIMAANHRIGYIIDEEWLTLQANS